MSMQKKLVPQKDSDAVKIGEPVEVRSNSEGLKMLVRVKKDEKLEKINGTVLDQMQKIIDEVNVGHNYIQKTKILQAQLEYYVHLRNYEHIIRKATHLTVDSDPTSLDQLRDRLCTDPWLGLFFDHVNECRVNNKKKKMTTTNWTLLKQTIIAYYFNFFLHKKHKVVIKKSKLPTFASSCILMKQETNRFKDLFVFELNNGLLNKNKVDEDDLYMADDYLEPMETFKDEFRNVKYDTISELLEATQEIWRDDPDNFDIIQNLQRLGIKNLRGTWSAIMSISSASADLASNIASATLTAGGQFIDKTGKVLSAVGSAAGYGVVGVGGGLLGGIGGAALWIGAGLSMPFAVPILATGAAVGAIGSMFGHHYGYDDGASVANVSKYRPKYEAVVSKYQISIGKIIKEPNNNNKWIQKGFFITLCYFIDELLEECRAVYEKKEGAIEWGDEEPVYQNGKNFYNFEREKDLLRQIVSVIPTADQKQFYDDIQKLETTSIKKIRDQLDVALIAEIKKYVKNDTEFESTLTDKNLETVRTDVKKWWSVVSDEAKKDTNNKQIATSISKIDTWRWDSSASGGAKAVTSDGECGYSAPKKDGSGRNYRKSPQFRAMKKGLKDGSVSKKEYKDGKKELKRILG